MTHQFTDEQIESVIQEIGIGYGVERCDQVRIAHIILEARAKCDAILMACGQRDVALDRVIAERDAALARVKAGQDRHMAFVRTYRWTDADVGALEDRIAVLETENAELRKYDLRRVTPIIPAERIAENERLRLKLMQVYADIGQYWGWTLAEALADIYAATSDEHTDVPK